jgi:hypothetical protein
MKDTYLTETHQEKVAARAELDAIRLSGVSGDRLRIVLNHASELRTA